jgi:hypothetical protein
MSGDREKTILNSICLIGNTFLTIARLEEEHCLLTFLICSSQGKWLKLGPFKMGLDDAFETVT